MSESGPVTTLERCNFDSNLDSHLTQIPEPGVPLTMETAEFTRFNISRRPACFGGTRPGRYGCIEHHPGEQNHHG